MSTEDPRLEEFKKITKDFWVEVQEYMQKYPEMNVSTYLEWFDASDYECIPPIWNSSSGTCGWLNSNEVSEWIRP